jgi:hypothetical protein
MKSAYVTSSFRLTNGFYLPRLGQSVGEWDAFGALMTKKFRVILSTSLACQCFNS